MISTIEVIKRFLLSVVLGLTVAFIINTIDSRNDIYVEKGGVYIYTFELNSDNPFEEIEIDTVKVLQVKNGYVKYLYNYKEKDTAYFLSLRLSYFKKHIKKLDSKIKTIDYADTK